MIFKWATHLKYVREDTNRKKGRETLNRNKFRDELKTQI